jgi:DNA adenine methylase
MSADPTSPDRPARARRRAERAAEADERDRPSRAKPFLKWAGGKRQLLAQLDRFVPARFGTYHEPFVGGGALFFHLAPAKAVLTDNNDRLVRAYRGVRDGVERVIRLLSSYPHDKEFFLSFREHDVDRDSDAEVAAWMIYLNKTGFNGLYRVNSQNRFNVPFGRYTDPNICDEDGLRACSRALADADLPLGEDFTSVLHRAKKGDFVYFDPPYVPLSASSSFTSYTSEGFGLAEHARLRDVALDLKQRGVHVLLSNSSAPAVLELYAEGFTVERVDAQRAVNSKASGRGPVTELIIR